jgi:hypothetical protein
MQKLEILSAASGQKSYPKRAGGLIKVFRTMYDIFGTFFEH